MNGDGLGRRRTSASNTWGETWREKAVALGLDSESKLISPDDVASAGGNARHVGV